MTRDKKISEARIATRIPDNDLNKLDRKVEEMQKKHPGLKITRSDAVRTAISEFVKEVK